MTALRVALDGTPLLGSRSGIGWWTASLLDALAAQGELDLVAFGLAFRSRKLLAEAVPDGVRVADRWFSILPLRGMWLRTDMPPAEWWCGSVDVVHGTNFLVPPTRRAGELVTVHDLTAWRYPELVHPDTLAMPTLVERALRRGAWVHTNSEAIAAEVAETLPVPQERIRVVAPGIPEVASVNPGHGRSVAGAGRYILALGTVEPRKDYPGLVRAFDTVADSDPEVRLVIAGGGGWGSDVLADALVAARHGDRVRRLGYVSDENRAALLRDAAVLAYPSVYEGFGFPPLEAMSVEVPVVATRAGSLAEVCADAAILVDVGDTDALADALVAVLDDRDLRADLVAAGRHNVSRFSWEACAASMSALYADVAAASRVRA